MSDRWKDVLADLQQVSPSDEVYRRAQRGPTRPDPPWGPGRPKRLVAGVTAFAVFALAAAFAWNIVRHTDGSGNAGTVPPSPPSASQLLLWPERSADQVAEVQARADEGDPDVEWRLDPKAVAERFASDVLGWRGFATQISVPPGDGEGEAYAQVEQYPAACPSPLPGEEMSSACTTPGAESLSLTQPGKTGDGGVWVVGSVRSHQASVETGPGAIAEGTAVAAHADAIAGLPRIAAMIVGEPGSACDSVTIGDKPSLEGETTVTAHLGEGCGSESAAYVYVAISHGEPFTGDAYLAHPLDGGRNLLAFAAVPLVVTASGAPSPVATATSTYTGTSGWKVDYPDGWTVTPIDSVDYKGAAISNHTGALPAPDSATPEPIEPDPGAAASDAVSLSVTQFQGSSPYSPAPGDDSSLPLAFADFRPFGQGRSGLDFQANGVVYQAWAFEGPEATEADKAVLDAAVASIRVPALARGDSSNGWLSLGSADDYHQGTPATAGRLSLVVVFRAPGGDYVLDIPPDHCAEGYGETWDPVKSQILIACHGRPDVRYQRNGTPIPGNPSGLDKPLEPYAAVTAWDGSLLVDIGRGEIDRHAVRDYWA